MTISVLIAVFFVAGSISPTVVIQTTKYLQVILPYWLWFRNIFILMFVALIVINFSFKKKSFIFSFKDLFGGILLVLFSYAIAGLIHDLILLLIIIFQKLRGWLF